MTIGAELPALASQVSALKAGLALTQAYGMDIFSRYEEQAAVYILPETVDRARVVRVLQETALALRSQGEAVQIDDLSFGSDPASLTLTLALSGDPQAVAHFLSLLDLSGRITLSDVLGKDATDQFLLAVSVQSPLSMPAASLFLALDPLQYALDPLTAEDKLFADVPAAQAAALKSDLLDSPVGALRSQLTPIATVLKAKRVWPLPLLSVNRMDREQNKWTVDVKLFERSGK